MASQQFPTSIRARHELVALESAQVDQDGFLVLDVAGRRLGPPTLRTDAREPFVVL